VIAGTQTGTSNSSETPALLLTGKEGFYIRHFNGAYFYFLQHLFSVNHQLVIKYDWYDANARVKGKEIGVAGNGFTAADIKCPGQVEIINTDQPIATLTDKSASFDAEIKVEKGIGYVSREVLQKDKVDIGTITLDANFTPIRRVNYEVENMRVGDRTDFNRLKLFIETDGIIEPHEALEKSIEIMINQLRAIVGFKEEEVIEEIELPSKESESKQAVKEIDAEVLKTRIETLDLSQRTVNALATANIRTVGGLARKKEEDLLDIDGLGPKGIQEIKRALSNFGITLK
jgi:DNA-directed RNA polymerase subunit alpha